MLAGVRSVEKFIIKGGRPLSGTIDVHGAKNAVLPILAAAILTRGTVRIHSCPDLADVDNMLAILQHLGCGVDRYAGGVAIEPGPAQEHRMPDEFSHRIRSSIFMLGPILGRFHRACFTYPGGCEIGLRPVDLHLNGLRALGARIDESHGLIYCEGELHGAEVHLDYPSVGATENVMMAAVLARGTTLIRNAAREPEILDLQRFINRMGGKITGAGSSTIRVEGVSIDELTDVEYTVLPDRIVAGTYMVAAAMTGGDIRINGAVGECVAPVTAKLREAGCRVLVDRDAIRVSGQGPLKAVDLIETLPYPGFPTDMQAQMMSMAAIAGGTTVIVENVFENRFRHAAELRRMGARITIKNRMAIVQGVPQLKGAQVSAWDLRAGAALVLAGLVAEGETVVTDVEYIDRGYERLEQALAGLGADIVRVY